VPDEYVIDRLLKLRRSSDIYIAKVRWFYYGPKDDCWEPLENLPRNVVIRFLRRKKKKIAGYSWSIPKPPSRGTRRSPRLNQAETALVVTPQRQEPKWSPTILAVLSNFHGEIRITLNWVKISQSHSVQETYRFVGFDLHYPNGRVISLTTPGWLFGVSPSCLSGMGRTPTCGPAPRPYRTMTRPPCLLPKGLDPSLTGYCYLRSMT